MADETPENPAPESNPPDAAPETNPPDAAPETNPPDAAPESNPPEAVSPTTPEEPAPEPTPLDVPLEEQIGSLPPLEYPGGSRDQDFDKWAADKRRGRIRTEIVGGVLIILGGAVASVVTGKSAFFVLAIFGVGALAAYEFLVTSFE